MSFSVYQAFSRQRKSLKGLAKSSQQFLNALGWPGELRPDQWSQLQATVLEFEPDCILEVGRGNGLSTLAMLLAGQKLKKGPQLYSVCNSDGWEQNTLPKIRSFLPKRWDKTVHFFRESLAKQELPSNVFQAKKLLILWYSNDKNEVDKLLREVMPKLDSERVLLVVRDAYDLRYYGEEQRRYPSLEEESYHTNRVFLEHSDNHQSTGVPILDFLNRNDLAWNSGAHDVKTGIADLPSKEKELKKTLGEPWYTGQGSWFYSEWSRESEVSFFPPMVSSVSKDLEDRWNEERGFAGILWRQRKALHASKERIEKLHKVLQEPGSLPLWQWTILTSLVLHSKPDLVLEVGRPDMAYTAALLDAVHLLPERCSLLTTAHSPQDPEDFLGALRGLSQASDWLTPVSVYHGELALHPWAEELSKASHVLLVWYSNDSLTTAALLEHVLPALQGVEVKVLLTDLHDVRHHLPQESAIGERWNCGSIDIAASQGQRLFSFLHDNRLKMVSLADEMVPFCQENPAYRDFLEGYLGTGFFSGIADWFVFSWPADSQRILERDGGTLPVKGIEALLPLALWNHRLALKEAYSEWLAVSMGAGDSEALPPQQWLFQEALVAELKPDLVMEIGRSDWTSTLALMHGIRRANPDGRLFSTSFDSISVESLREALLNACPESHRPKGLLLHQGDLDRVDLSKVLTKEIEQVLVFLYAEDRASIRSLLTDWLPELHSRNVTIVFKGVHDLRFTKTQNSVGMERLTLNWLDVGKELGLALVPFLQKHNRTLVSMAEEVDEAAVFSAKWKATLVHLLGKELFNGVGDWGRCDLPPGTLAPPVAMETALRECESHLPLALWKQRETLVTLESILSEKWPEEIEPSEMDSNLQWAGLILDRQPRLIVEIGRSAPATTWCLAETARLLPSPATVVSVDTELLKDVTSELGSHWHGVVGPPESVEWERFLPEHGEILVLWSDTRPERVATMLSTLLPQWSSLPLTVVLSGVSELRFLGENRATDRKDCADQPLWSMRTQSGSLEMPLSLVEPWCGFSTLNRLQLRSSAQELSEARAHSPRWSRLLGSSTGRHSLSTGGNWTWFHSDAVLTPFARVSEAGKQPSTALFSHAIWKQRDKLVAARPRLEAWQRVLGESAYDELSTHQWVQLWAMIWDFEPDLVLQIGRGSGVLTLATQEALRDQKGVSFVSVSTDDKFERTLLPAIQSHLPEDWEEGFSCHVREPVTLEYDRILRGKKRVLLLWVSPEPQDAALVMSRLLPAIATRPHLLALINSSDVRFQDSEPKEDTSRKTPEFSHRLVQIGDLRAPAAVATEVLDFATRNKISLCSGSLEMLEYCDQYKARAAELDKRLGAPWFLQAGSWWGLQLCSAPSVSWKFSPYGYEFPHHPVFYELDPFRGEIPLGFIEDYVGTRVRYEYLQHKPPQRTEVYTYSDFPVIDEEYFEWIDILESVMNASEEYVMVELGAGYGRWSARAALAAKQKGIPSITLRPVEADPHHAQKLRRHLSENGLTEQEFEVVEAVVGAEEGEVEFYIGSSRHDGLDEEAIWYGQSKAGDFEELQEESAGETYGGRPVLQYASGQKAIQIPQVPLSHVLKGLQKVDLLDMDVQGEEWNVISASVKLLNKRVKRIHIGTHGHELEDSIRALLLQEGWTCLADYPCHGVRETEYGDVEFVDGVQSWLNPRLS